MHAPTALFAFKAVASATKESCMHGVLNKIYLQFFLKLGVTFRDESNDGN